MFTIPKRQSSLVMRAVGLLFGVLAFTSLGSHAYAQADQGGISGNVHDASGARIAGATVRLRDTATGFTITTRTDEQGSYVASPLKLGIYQITAQANGFATATQDNVPVNAATTTTANLEAGVEGAQQNVTVTTAPPALQTEEAATGQVVSSKMINDTPLNGRNFTFIAQLTAGVEPSEQGSRGANKGDFSANGQRSEQNNFILDGVDNNSNLMDFLNGASFVIKPPPDALQEFNVQTGDYTAELGHSAGAVLNVATKSGGNQIHGDIWEYFRNDVLNARDYFETVVPKYRQNQFGATLGGPIWKDKLFFFGDAEANRVIFGQTGVYTVPTALMRTGNFTELLNAQTNGQGQAITLYQPGGPIPGQPNTNLIACNGQQNVICPQLINGIGQKLLNVEPLPNLGNAGNTINNYTFQGNASDNTTQYDGRLDWNISQKDQTFARYSYSNQPVSLTAPLGTLDGGSFGGSGRTVTEGRNFTLSETHVLTPTLINEFRFGYNWIAAAYTPLNSGSDLSTQFGIGGIPFTPGNGGLPYFNFGNNGLSSFGSPQYEPTEEYENAVQVLDNVTKQFSKHSLKFGVDFERIRVQTNQPVDPKGTFNFDGKFSQDPNNTGSTGYGAADMLLDNLDSSQLANLFTAHNQRWYRSAYVQDVWKVTPKLTLNLGLRYEYFTPYVELNGFQANFVPNYATGSAQYLIPSKAQNTASLTQNFLTALGANNVTVKYTNNNYLVDPAYLNFSPRLGVAYSIDPKTVVRAGYGIFFGGLESLGYSPNLSTNFPFQYNSSFPSGNCSVGNCPTNGQTLETGFSQALGAGLANFVSFPGFNSFQVNTQTPYSEQFNLTVQREITNSTSATIAYVGSVSRHLQNNPDGNQPAFPIAPGVNEQPLRPFNNFGGSSIVVYVGSASYNSLQLTLERHLMNGLSFLGAYTWSHSLDDANTILGGTGQVGYRNPRLLGYGYDYGTSYINVGQRFALNTQYELPFGYGKRYLNQQGILNALSGGWATALVFRVQSGQPVGLVGNNNAAGNGTVFPYMVADPFKPGGTPTSTNQVCATKTRTVQTWFNPCAFVNPTQGANIAAYGPQGLVEVNGPGYNRVDLSAFKNFAVYRETTVQFRGDVFNLFNTPAYGQPGNTTGGGFGQITSERFGGGGTAGESPDARVVQFALKYIF